MLLDNKINVFLAICFLLLNVQCKKTKYTDDNYFGGKVIILGHRGMGMLYLKPGNTYDAISPAIGIGADGAEVDIQLTKDTVLVLFHDHLLNPSTTGTGRVYEKDWDEIKNYKYATFWPYNICVNAVDELFSKIPNLTNSYFSFDCSKVDNDVSDKELYRDQYIRAIKRLCDKYNMSNNVFIEGDIDLLIKAQKLGLTNKLFLFSELNENAINDACNKHFFGFSVAMDCLYNNVSLAHQKGLYVMAWSPNNFSQNEIALDNKVDIIQTDDPISILKLLNRYNYEYTNP